MDRRLSVTMLAMFVGGAACAGLARADIYTWVDARGIVNYSDNPPPKGVQAIGVVRDIALRNAAPADPAAAREAAQQAEMQAMAERIRMLEREVDQAGRQAPPLQYAAAPRRSFRRRWSWFRRRASIIISSRGSRFVIPSRRIHFSMPVVAFAAIEARPPGRENGCNAGGSPRHWIGLFEITD